MGGKFQRYIVRRDLTAIHAGELTIDLAYYREVPGELERGVYEIIEGSATRGKFELWFSGRALSGPWTLEKISEESWRLVRGDRSREESTQRRSPRRAGTS